MISTKVNFRHIFSVLAIFSAITLFSCQKDTSVNSEPVSDDEAVTISQENAEADEAYEETAEMGISASADLEAAAKAGHGDFGVGIHANLELFADLSFRLGPCVTITVTPNDTTYPKTVVIDFGDGCICRDGKFRKGSITLNFTKPLRAPGAVLTISHNNYYVNRAHIEGTKTITNMSATGVFQYSVVVSDGKVTWLNGRGFKFEKVKTVTQISGSETATVRDDVFSIEGRSRVVYANGITVNKETEVPLIKAVACNWISKGIVKIRINNRELSLDYGNGDCDDKAILKWNGHEREVTLP
ncbi:MAG TPA: hypothetical protein VEB42_09445 [Chitinophagaceae bacterium]|nr:hypothetical protein [Chitinophagaceae bacterium]